MKYLGIFGFGAVLLALGAAILVDKHLSADGVNYFTIVLETHDFFRGDWWRQLANYLSQAPLVVAVNAGVKNMSALSLVFGASILFPWLLALGLSLFALRDEDKSVLIFMMVSMVSINLGSDFILTGEHQVMVLLTWPILFYHLRISQLRWYDALILWSLLLLFSRLYPTAVIPAAIFLLIAVVRIVRSSPYKQKVVFLGASLLSSIVIAAGTYTILYPRAVENKQAFLESILRPFGTSVALTAMAFAVLLSAGWFWRKRFLVWLSLLPVVGFLAHIVLTRDFLSSGESFEYRTLTLTLLPVLMLGAVAIHCRRRTLDNRIALVVGAFIAVMITGNLYGTWQWSQFKSQMTEILIARDGLVPIESTDLNGSLLGWPWNNAQLSVVWSQGCVRSILLNADGAAWQPAGPPQTFRLKEYLCYTAEFQQYDPTLCLCEPQSSPGD